VKIDVRFWNAGDLGGREARFLRALVKIQMSTRLCYAPRFSP
jgi:hypothetical protein